MAACRDCDALYRFGGLNPGDRAVCPHCGGTLARARPNALHRASALAVSAATLFLVANFFPFIALEIGGQVNSIGLAESVGALNENGRPLLAAAVAVFILGAPGTMLGGMLYLLLPLFRGYRLPGAMSVCRFVYGTGHWNMIEVFLIGVLVSLLKLMDMATVTIGISFWAFCGLILCMTASLSAIDRRELWDRLEAARCRVP